MRSSHRSGSIWCSVSTVRPLQRPCVSGSRACCGSPRKSQYSSFGVHRIRGYRCGSPIASERSGSCTCPIAVTGLPQKCRIGLRWRYAISYVRRASNSLLLLRCRRRNDAAGCDEDQVVRRGDAALGHRSRPRRTMMRALMSSDSAGVIARVEDHVIGINTPHYGCVIRETTRFLSDFKIAKTDARVATRSGNWWLAAAGIGVSY
jgi:hypothetical protein